MKSFNFKQLVIIGLTLFVANGAYARDHKLHSSTPASDPVPALETTHSSSDNHWGLGYGSLSMPTLMSAGNTSAVTAVYRLDSKQMIQGYFTMPTTSPFSFLVVGEYKYTVVESQNAGFHLGGGVGLGPLPSIKGGTSFDFNIGALAGVHFHFTDMPRVMFSFDGGPTFTSFDGTSDFTISSLSGLLGLSVVYLF